MKTILLRILRRAAYHRIGVCHFKSQPFERDVYLIGYRTEIKPHYNCRYLSHKATEAEAIKALAAHRRLYILDYVRPRIKARNQKRYNKMLKKL